MVRAKAEAKRLVGDNITNSTPPRTGPRAPGPSRAARTNDRAAKGKAAPAQVRGRQGWAWRAPLPHRQSLNWPLCGSATADLSWGRSSQGRRRFAQLSELRLQNREQIADRPPMRRVAGVR